MLRCHSPLRRCLKNASRHTGVILVVVDQGMQGQAMARGKFDPSVDQASSTATKATGQHGPFTTEGIGPFSYSNRA